MVHYVKYPRNKRRYTRKHNKVPKKMMIGLMFLQINASYFNLLIICLRKIKVNQQKHSLLSEILATFALNNKKDIV